MSNWITYLVKYRSDKLLYQTHIAELKKASELRVTSYSLPGAPLDIIAKLEKSVTDAEYRLENYIDNNADPREVARQADEKLFLSYRYLCGMTMMETADAMSVSRDTVYRIRRRILSRPLPFGAD